MSVSALFETENWKKLQWLYEHKCKAHGHRYLVHYNCYLKEQNEPEKIGFLDIETGGSLTADWGVMLSWAILPIDSNKILGGTVNPHDIVNTNIRDKNLVKGLCFALKQFDTVIVYYGKDAKWRHDIPFSRTRALTHLLTDFPKAGSLNVIDVYDIIKGKFKLTVRKQESGCRQFSVPYGKHHATPNIWLSALQGNKEALDYVWLHNQEDVRALKRLFKKVCNYTRTRTKI